MYKKKKILVVIPARSGSQEIENRGFFIGLGNKAVDNKTINFYKK